jgi:hypothetical protein
MVTCTVQVATPTEPRTRGVQAAGPRGQYQSSNEMPTPA